MKIIFILMETVKFLINQDLAEAFKANGLEMAGEALVQPADLDRADFTCNLCFRLAREAKCAPNVLADKIAEAINNKYKKSEQNEYKVYSTSGYINFTVNDSYKINWLNEVEAKGLSAVIKAADKKMDINLEFISANPTGPLTLANGRAGFLGDALSNILELVGHKVTREYYINDAGNQIKILGRAVKARLGLIKAEDNYYQGEYIADLAEKFKDQADLEDEDFGRVLAEYLLKAEIKPVILHSMGVKIESWISEYKDIRRVGFLEQILAQLKETVYTYKEEGAVWLKTTAFGDDKDRVLIKADGEMTYFLVDIAYHYHKLQRGFDKLITILGADHYGHIKRMQAGLRALGYDPKLLEIVILQMIKLYQGGAEIKMSKRAGNYVLMQQALNEVPADLLRFYLLSYNPNSQVDIDLDALSSKSDKNPVYSVQYMFARLNSMLQKASELKILEFNADELSDEWQRLFKELYYLPQAIERAGENCQPNLLAGAILSLALTFHKYYEKERLIVFDRVIFSRHLLIKALHISVKEALKILGISAPDRMIK
ncbi:MAG: Arginine-tRNA ligase [candidate division CPR1 bacterium GW2011_GWA2_42_17]|uniref:Arginine--tRNA ligase n=1 Tax=candidate division CPR1 bacterium GW2011_GWA2_42_17 TaxID=1618341 RepID=A0A0G0Z552_9BACT|nr:MAG: Arginine-tRNA ligase [candidate division CPR1 bacterium GW2011_GWA2_42_17]